MKERKTGRRQGGRKRDQRTEENDEMRERSKIGIWERGEGDGREKGLEKEKEGQRNGVKKEREKEEGGKEKEKTDGSRDDGC